MIEQQLGGVSKVRIQVILSIAPKGSAVGMAMPPMGDSFGELQPAGQAGVSGSHGR